MLKSYAHHKPSDEAVEKIRMLRQAFSDLDDLITSTAPASRERSVAITNLETAAMWAIKSIVVNDPESVAAP
jgi:hypothetical protein